jgi:hypothetical protein
VNPTLDLRPVIPPSHLSQVERLFSNGQVAAFSAKLDLRTIEVPVNVVLDVVRHVCCGLLVVSSQWIPDGYFALVMLT